MRAKHGGLLVSIVFVCAVLLRTPWFRTLDRPVLGDEPAYNALAAALSQGCAFVLERGTDEQRSGGPLPAVRGCASLYPTARRTPGFPATDSTSRRTAGSLMAEPLAALSVITGLTVCVWALKRADLPESRVLVHAIRRDLRAALAVRLDRRSQRLANSST